MPYTPPNPPNPDWPDQPRVPEETKKLVLDALHWEWGTLDPYAQAVAAIVTALEWALDDGINSQMSEGEMEILESLARRLQDMDDYVDIQPRVG